mmetsp:Transcript_23255/g.56040  ORF Transcript_23255/g.56040 Transcript_23255/m.56040 type:complete len:262 (+) Transcript_23255:1746-2531(+)
MRRAVVRDDPRESVCLDKLSGDSRRCRRGCQGGGDGDGAQHIRPFRAIEQRSELVRKTGRQQGTLAQHRLPACHVFLAHRRERGINVRRPPHVVAHRRGSNLVRDRTVIRRGERELARHRRLVDQNRASTIDEGRVRGFDEICKGGPPRSQAARHSLSEREVARVRLLVGELSHRDHKTPVVRNLRCSSFEALDGLVGERSHNRCIEPSADGGCNAVRTVQNVVWRGDEQDGSNIGHARVVRHARLRRAPGRTIYGSQPSE